MAVPRCPVCVTCFHHEEVLPYIFKACGHSVCESCISQLDNKCPLCNVISSGTVKNFAMIDLMQTVDFQAGINLKSMRDVLIRLAEQDFIINQKNIISPEIEKLQNDKEKIIMEIKELIKKKVSIAEKETQKQLKALHEQKIELENEIKELTIQRQKELDEFTSLNKQQILEDIVQERKQVHAAVVNLKKDKARYEQELNDIVAEMKDYKLYEKKKIEEERDKICQQIMKYRAEAASVRDTIGDLINRRNDLDRDIQERELKLSQIRR